MDFIFLNSKLNDFPRVFAFIQFQFFIQLFNFLIFILNFLLVVQLRFLKFQFFIIHQILFPNKPLFFKLKSFNLPREHLTIGLFFKIQLFNFMQMIFVHFTLFFIVNNQIIYFCLLLFLNGFLKLKFHIQFTYMNCQFLFPVIWSLSHLFFFFWRGFKIIFNLFVKILVFNW